MERAFQAGFMNSIGTEACRTIILDFIAANNLDRLKEMLHVIFDVNQVYAMDSQREILSSCSLVPIQEQEPWPRVTFCLQAGVIAPNPSTSSSSLVQPRTPSAYARSWPSSEEDESD